MKLKALTALIAIFSITSAAFSYPGEVTITKVQDRIAKFKYDNTVKLKPLRARQASWIDISELNLTPEELYYFAEIQEREQSALRPIALDLEVKYLRQEELKKVNCHLFQRQCKKELKRDMAFLDDDIKELKRQIWQKKEYYKILYINTLTREQSTKLRRIIYKETKAKPQLW